MKRTILILSVLMLLSGCARKPINTAEGESSAQAETLLRGMLWRYVDHEYGVVVYIGVEGRMTSQPLKDQQ